MNRTKTLLILALASLVVACGTAPARDVHYSGFLGDYSELVKGDAKQAERRYVRPDVDWASYTKVLLDPVTFWRGNKSRKEGVSGKDAQDMTNYFHGVIYRTLENQGFEMVDSPQPHTLRVQVALTKLNESHVVMDVVSTVVPVGIALSGAQDLLTGKPSFVGSATIEVKVTDSETGELLGAGVDGRVGGKSLEASQFSSWGDVKKIMNQWAEQGSYNLCELQKHTNCIAPKT